MPEGSVHVDNGGADLSQTNDDVKDTGVGEGESTETKDTVVVKDEGGEGEGEQKLTDKGTKIDPNPESAAHQLLANAEKKLRDYETVLRSPELLRKFAKEAGYSLEEAKVALQEEKEELYSADKLQTNEDIAKALNELRSTSVKESKTYKEKIDALEKELTGFRAGRQSEKVATTLTTDVSAIREKYPELDPKDPSYDKDLEKEIGEMFAEFDFDEKTGSFRGNYSLLKLTDRVMKAAGRAKKKGSEEAQTDVKIKERGKVTTSGKPSSGAAESDDAGTAIAQRIARSFKR